MILEKSTLSPFGRGSENVVDASYRSGREITASDIGVEEKIDYTLHYSATKTCFQAASSN